MRHIGIGVLAGSLLNVFAVTNLARLLSMFRSGKVKGIRFKTLAKFCAALGCTPVELLGYDFDAVDLQGGEED